MTQHDDRPVLLATDGESDSDAALHFAAREASARGVGLTLVHVYAVLPRGPQTALLEFADAEEIASSRLRHAVEHAQEVLAGQVAVTGRLVRDKIVQGVVESSSEAQLVVLQRRDLAHLTRLVTRSTSSGVAAHAHAPVAVVPESWTGDGAGGRAGVVVGLDVSSRSRRRPPPGARRGARPAGRAADRAQLLGPRVRRRHAHRAGRAAHLGDRRDRGRPAHPRRGARRDRGGPGLDRDRVRPPGRRARHRVPHGRARRRRPPRPARARAARTSGRWPGRCSGAPSARCCSWRRRRSTAAGAACPTVPGTARRRVTRAAGQLADRGGSPGVLCDRGRRGDRRTVVGHSARGDRAVVAGHPAQPAIRSGEGRSVARALERRQRDRALAGHSQRRCDRAQEGDASEGDRHRESQPVVGVDASASRRPRAARGTAERPAPAATDRV